MKTKKKPKVETIQSMGGNAVKKKFGPNHFRDLAKKRWAKTEAK